MEDNPRLGRKLKTVSNESGLWESMQRFWSKAYAGDYLGLVVILTAYILVKLVEEPFHQQFALDDTRIQHPHAEQERVPVRMLPIGA